MVVKYSRKKMVRRTAISPVWSFISVSIRREGVNRQNNVLAMKNTVFVTQCLLIITRPLLWISADLVENILLDIGTTKNDPLLVYLTQAVNSLNFPLKCFRYLGQLTVAGLQSTIIHSYYIYSAKKRIKIG